MAMHFEELDATTREFMLKEFEVEQASGAPYLSKALSAQGLAAFPDFMRSAIRSGNEETLFQALNHDRFWKAKSSANGHKIPLPHAAERLAHSEFNTWYVRGLSQRLTSEGETKCQVYRAALPKDEPAACSEHEGEIRELKEIYEGHRARYWPILDQTKFSIPFSPNCHHTIRRIAKSTSS
jgi:hypothetical protein